MGNAFYDIELNANIIHTQLAQGTLASSQYFVKQGRKRI